MRALKVMLRTLSVYTMGSHSSLIVCAALVLTTQLSCKPSV